MSLIDILHDEIKKEGYISYDRMSEVCRENNYRTETGRRRLERDESPHVKHIFGSKKRGGGRYVKGYKWIKNPDEAPEKEMTEKELIIHSLG